MSDMSLALAAFAATPRLDAETEEDWVGRVSVNAQIMTANLDPKYSTILLALSEMETAHVFRATVTEVRKDERAPRLQVILYSQKNAEIGKSGEIYGQALPPGFQMIRTPPMFEKALFNHVGKTAMSLIGHEAFVWRSEQKFVKDGNTLKTSIIRHLKDLGVDNRFMIHTRTNSAGVEIPIKATLLHDSVTTPHA